MNQLLTFHNFPVLVGTCQTGVSGLGARVNGILAKVLGLMHFSLSDRCLCGVVSTILWLRVRCPPPSPRCSSGCSQVIALFSDL